MKKNLRITFKLMISAIVLLIILILIQKNPEEVPVVSHEEEDEAENMTVADKVGSASVYQLAALTPDREVCVLLTNPDGGCFFDTVGIRLKEHTYQFTKRDVSKRGTIRIQAGDERIEFLQKKSENCPALYSGSFILRCRKEGIYVVNSLLLEKYLTLVVPGEMPAGYPEEALKSQAILARTYAARCMLHPALPEFFADLDDTTGFQVYANCGENERTTKAVEDTAGSILCERDAVADVYYFSTSCGQTTTTEAWSRDVMQSSLPSGPHEASVHVGAGEAKYTPQELQNEEAFECYINGQAEDDFEKDAAWYRWTYETKLDQKKLFQRIRERYEAQPAQVLSRRAGSAVFSCEYLADPGRIRDISVTKRSPGGCAAELTVTGSKGTVRIRTEYSIRYVLCDPVSEVILQDGSAKKMGTLLPSAFFIIKTGKERQDVIGYNLVGGGFGHGIGMSQNGAAAMAGSGYDHRQILTFFYPEYQLKQYGSRN